MLVLSRKLHEKLLFPGIGATVQVVSIKGNAVRLAIEAPPEVAVVRAELIEDASGSAPVGVAAQARERNHQMRNRLHAAAFGLALLRKQQELGLTQDVGSTLERVEREVEAMRQALESEAKHAPAPPPAPARKRRALLVEDDDNERELLAGFLRLAGLDVDTAGDGTDALEHLRLVRPDVVLLDMGLPRCDGPTTVRAIRADPACAGLKILAVTGHAPERFGPDSGASGVDRWFRKPVRPDELLVELRRELAAAS